MSGPFPIADMAADHNCPLSSREGFVVVMEIYERARPQGLLVGSSRTADEVGEDDEEVSRASLGDLDASLDGKLGHRQFEVREHKLAPLAGHAVEEHAEARSRSFGAN